MVLSTLCTDSRTIIQQVGDFIRAELGKVKASEVITKDLNSLVSYVDRTAEARLVQGLTRLLPNSNVLAEEGTVVHTPQGNSPYRWVIDPLDGTTNFLHGIPHFNVSVALQRDGVTVMGIVLDVMRKECFYAYEGSAVFIDQNIAQVSATEMLSDSLLATGFPYYDFTRLDNYLAAFKVLMQATRGIRRPGAAALDLAYVATGRFDGFFEYALQPWDIAAGAFLVTQAGGTVTDFRGGDGWKTGGDIIATNKHIHAELEAIIKTAFYE